MKEGWKECVLEDIVEPIKETCIPDPDEQLNYIGLEHIEQESLRLNGVGNSTEVTSNKFKFDVDDILFGKLRVYFRKVVKVKFSGICSTDIWVMRAKEGYNQDFLFYFLANKDFIDLANGGEGGTRMPRADWNFLKITNWNLPPLPEQKAIASVLSSLDDKIDLLHRQNKTLEAMAETLFRQWFVEEAQEDWEEVELKTITDVGIGRTPPRKESHWFTENPADVKWISIKDLGNDGVFISKTSEYLTKEAVESFNIPIIPKDTVVLSFKMTVGRVAITSQDMTSNEAIAHFKFKEETPITKEFLYLFLKTFKYDSLGSTSSIVTAINSAMIKDLKVIVPDTQTLIAFKTQTEPIFDKIKSNQTQISKIAFLRDVSLPKLVSGEVQVSYKEAA